MTTKRKSKSKPKPKTETLTSTDPNDRARLATMPEINAGSVMDAFSLYGGVDISPITRELQAAGTAVVRGDTGSMERMLVSQAHALEAVFVKLARNAANAEYINQLDTNLKLALRAQNQCRMTLETLATIKNPRPVAFVKQANMGENVQVNNGTPAPARKNENPPNELLEAPHAKPDWLDGSATRAAAPSNQEVEAVETLNRAKDKGRQGKRKR